MLSDYEKRKYRTWCTDGDGDPKGVWILRESLLSLLDELSSQSRVIEALKLWKEHFGEDGEEMFRDATFAALDQVEE